MGSNKAFLVVGGDSLVGGHLFSSLIKHGHKAYATTRRKDSLSDQRVYLDFEDYASFEPPADVDYVYIVAAATNYDRCETDPLAHRINVELIPAFIKHLLKKNLFTMYVSTNSVFGGERPWPLENDPHDPQIAYAIQKHDSEKIAVGYAEELGQKDNFGIVRLTKILGADTSPLPSWFEAWGKNEMVTPFADLIFAPMSAQYVGAALVTLGEKRVPGCLHLSGAENVDYVRLAQTFAREMGVSQDLIEPTTATEKGIHIAFKPTYSGLGMERTTRLTGVKPQPLEDVVKDVLKK